WAAGDEIWVFEPAPAIRVVSLEGLQPVDPSQTQLPPEWMSLATYAARPGDTLKLVEQRRGDAGPQPGQPALDRHLSVRVDGAGQHPGHHLPELASGAARPHRAGTGLGEWPRTAAHPAERHRGPGRGGSPGPARPGGRLATARARRVSRGLLGPRLHPRRSD